MNAHHAPLRRLLAYALADRRLWRQALALLLLATVADVAGPLLIKVFIDDYLVPAQWVWAPIAALALGYVILQLIAAGAGYQQALRLNVIAMNAVQTLREQVYAKVVDLPITYFDRTPTGGIIARITNDTEAVKELYVNVIGTVVKNSVRILGIFIAMAVLDVRLMLICAVIVPIVVALMVFYQRWSGPRFHRARALLSEINARLHESLQGMRVIRLYGQEVRFQRQFTAVTEQHYQARLANVRLDALLLRPCVDMLHMLTLAALLFTFGFQSLDGVVQIGVLYAFIAYLGRFVEPVIEITQRLNLLQQAVVAGERVFELLDTPNIEPMRRADLTARSGGVRAEQVSFSYDGEHEVLCNVSFAIPPGAFYAIVGHTGSGKSTLANLLLRFYTPQHGKLLLDDHPLLDYPDAALRQAVGVVAQEPFLFAGSVRHNITLGEDVAEADIIATAHSTGLHEHVQRLPQGYDTPLDERGANLSTGQRQLLALTRALVRRPKLLILDEATAHIDSHSERQIQAALQALHGEVTLLVIAHRLSTVERADRILVLHHGELVEQGHHGDLLTRAGVYHRLYQLQALSEALP